MKTKLKTIDIKGTPYVTVNSRLKYFREEFIGHKLISEVISNIDGKCLIKATILNDKDIVVATGHAFEDESKGFINKTSYVENCETSAWGRALGCLGIGIDNEVRSYEEMTTALEGQKSKEARTKKYKDDVCAEVETIHKEDLGELLPNCKTVMEVTQIWWLMTKEQQEDKELKGWFTIRKKQLNDEGIYG
jgi:hypothetical protein